jgi:putative transposase
MKKSKFSEEQIIAALKEAESGMSVSEVCRKVGVTPFTFYKWRKKYAGMNVPEARRMRELEAENQKLKRLVANLSLANLALKDVLTKKW